MFIYNTLAKTWLRKLSKLFFPEVMDENSLVTAIKNDPMCFVALISKSALKHIKGYNFWKSNMLAYMLTYAGPDITDFMLAYILSRPVIF